MQWLSWETDPPFLLLGMTSCYVEHPFVQRRSAVLALSPSSLLPTPKPICWGRGWVQEKEQAFVLCKYCPAIAKTRDMSSTLSVTNPKHSTLAAQPYRLLWGKLTSSQPDLVATLMKSTSYILRVLPALFDLHRTILWRVSSISPVLQGPTQCNP